MPFEIDMLNVGNADAIILRYIDVQKKEYVVLIDAGKTKTHGQMVVEHIKKYTDKKSIDLAINTHPDKDHLGGFPYVIDNLNIAEFWMHKPENHVKGRELLEQIAHVPELLDKGLQYVLENLVDSNNLSTQLREKEIEPVEPFESLSHSHVPIKVLGPSKAYYSEQLKKFRDYDLIENILLEKSNELFSWSEDDLRKFDKLKDRSAANNSSVILFFEADGKRVLFTSDAGPDALNKVIDKYDLKNLDFLDIPHHGSEYNLNREIMDEFNPGTAYISCAGDNPSDVVVDYLKRLGTDVFSTKAHGRLRHRCEMPDREGWSPVKPL